MQYLFHTADVFAETRFSGNQLAVFPNAVGITEMQMQQIAREINFSETVFVFPPADEKNTRRVRIFTPEREIPFAGHPTIGTAYILVATGELGKTPEETTVLLEEGVGVVPVFVRMEKGKAPFMQFTTARNPEKGGTPPSTKDVAPMLGLDESDLLTGDDAPEFYSCGIPFLFVPLRSLDAVRRARMDASMNEGILSSYESKDVYVFSRETESPDTQIHSRMFAPTDGIPEDPATGSAAAALTGYLVRRLAEKGGTFRWTIEQGLEMGRPSLLHAEVDLVKGEIVATRVGGSAVLVSKGYLEL